MAVTSTRPSPVRAALPVVAALAFAWIAAGFHPFTWPMRIAVALPVLVAAVVTARAWSRPREGTAAPASRWHVAAWLGLLIAATTWELFALFSSPREDHPTLSSIGDDVMGTHAGRAVTFGLWLVVGWLLFVRPSVRRES